MRIALFNTVTPFVRGGAEILVDDLYDQLVKRGHKVTLFRIPFPDNYEVPLLETIYAARNLRFDDYDRVIAFKFPAYCATHPRKVLWFFHQFRQVYELYGKEYGLQDTLPGKALKEIIASIDAHDIKKSQLVYANAEEVKNRLKLYNGLDAQVLNPPLQEPERYHSSGIGDYVYYPSRITSLKRQHLAIQAMEYVKSDVKLVLSGKCDQPGYYESLLQMVKDNRLESKVAMENRWVSDEEKIHIMSKALGVMYIPYKEDSCGFVTMEGFYSGKPVITCHDSGGTAEFIENRVNGLFSEPNPEDLARCLDELYNDKRMAEAMGKAARESILEKNITWDETVRRLLL